MRIQGGTAIYALLVVSAAGVFFYVGQQQSGDKTAKKNPVSPSLPATQVKTTGTASAAAVAPIALEDSVQRFINARSKAEKISTIIALGSGLKLSDIPDFIKALHDLPDDEQKEGLIQSLLLRLAKEDPAKALALSDNLLDSKLRSFLVLGAFGQLAKISPSQALSQLAQMEPGSLQQAAFARVFQTLGGTVNIADVQALVDSLPDGSARDSALKGLVTGWLKIDPKAALDFASKFPSEYASFLKSTLTNVAVFNGQPALAAEYINKIQDAAVRNEAIVSIASVWAAGPHKDPVAALDWISQVATDATYAKAVSNIFLQLAKNDPKGASSLIDKVADGKARTQAISSVASSWGKTDPSAAVGWANALPASDTSPALNAIVSTWSKSDPASALAYVQNSSDPTIFLNSAPALAQAEAQLDAPKALAFAQSLPDGSPKNQAINNVLVSLAKTDFTSAWGYATNLAADESRDGVMANLVGVEANKNPGQAATLIEKLPMGTSQTKAVAVLATSWINQDPQAFTTWLNGLPSGDARDTAIVQLVSSVQASKNPEGVMQWVGTVSNAETKAELMQKLSQPLTAAGK